MFRGLQVRYYAFTAAWEDYLGCGISFHTNLGNGYTAFLSGTKYQDASVCGPLQTFSATAGNMITSVVVTTAAANADGFSKRSVTGIVQVPVDYNCSNCLAGTYKSAAGTQVGHYIINQYFRQ